jgi:hypothetical protein
MTLRHFGVSSFVRPSLTRRVVKIPWETLAASLHNRQKLTVKPGSAIVAGCLRLAKVAYSLRPSPNGCLFAKHSICMSAELLTLW